MITRRKFIKGVASLSSLIFKSQHQEKDGHQVECEIEPKYKIVCDESQIANRVWVLYRGIEYHGHRIWFPTNCTILTEPANDEESQRKYGIRTKLIETGGMTKESAEGLRDLYLKEYARPLYSISMER